MQSDEAENSLPRPAETPSVSRSETSPQDDASLEQKVHSVEKAIGYSDEAVRRGPDMSTEGMLFEDGPATQAVSSKSRAAGRENQMTSKKHLRPVRDLSELVPGRASDTSNGFFVEDVETRRLPDELILDQPNRALFDSLVREFRHRDNLRRHGLTPRRKLLFCGPPGCGKTLAAEIFAVQTGLPFRVLRIDALVSSFLGETASNLRKVFDDAARRPSVLFLDEFDAIAHTRLDQTEHSEMRRVVNSLLLLIENRTIPGAIIAATNLQDKIDRALWRRFDEVVLFDLPGLADVKAVLRLKTRNYPAEFDISKKALKLRGMSYADIERVCMSAIKLSILDGGRRVSEKQFETAIQEERRRQKIKTRLDRRLTR